MRDFGESLFETIVKEHEAIVAAAPERDVAACQVTIEDHLKHNILPSPGMAAA